MLTGPALRGRTPRRQHYKPSFVPIASVAGLALLTGALSAVGLGFVVILPVGLAVGWHAMRSFFRQPLRPVAILMAGSALGVLVFLPSTPGTEGRRGSLVLYGLAMFIAVVAAFLSVQAPTRSRLAERLAAARSMKSIDALMLGSVALAVFGGTVGLLGGNSPSLLAGDVYQLLLTPAIYFIVTETIIDRDDIRKVLPFVIALLLLQQARDAVTATQLLSPSGLKRIHSVFWMHNLAGFIGAVILSATSRRAQRVAWLLTAGLFLVIGMLSGFRTYVLLAVALLAVIGLRRTRITIRLAAIGLAVLLPLALVFSLILPSARTAVDAVSQSYLERSDPGLSTDVSAVSRELEAKTVLAEIAATLDPGRFLMGFGAGATFELSSDASIYALNLYQDRDFRVHNVHFSPAAFGFRYGIVGIAYFIWLFVVAGGWSVARFARSSDPRLWFAPLTVGAFLIASFGFDHLPGDVIFAIALALLATDVKIHGYESTGASSEVATPGPRP